MYCWIHYPTTLTSIVQLQLHISCLFFSFSNQRHGGIISPDGTELFIWYCAGFTGIDDPYEPPCSCEVCICCFVPVGIIFLPFLHMLNNASIIGLYFI